LPVPQTSLRVLFVADSSDDLELIRQGLSRHGFEVQSRVIGTRAEFHDALQEGPWDVVLGDHSMRVVTSADVLHLLREHDADIPFISVSNTTDDDAPVEAMRAGEQDQVLSTNLRQLGATVEREVREAANRRMRRSTQAALQGWNIACGTRNARKPEA
jgi:PleD family two-component response regulator